MICFFLLGCLVPVLNGNGGVQSKLSVVQNRGWMTITISNQSEVPIKIWGFGDSFGDGQLEILIRDRKSGKIWSSRYGHRVYRRNIPKVKSIAPGKSYKYSVPLNRESGWTSKIEYDEINHEVICVVFSPPVDQKSLSEGISLTRLVWKNMVTRAK